MVSALNRLLREYNPTYMEWSEYNQLAECGYYPTHTNMDSSMDKWILTDSLFSYVSESSLPYLAKSKKSSLPTLNKDLAGRLMEILNYAIKSTPPFVPPLIHCAPLYCPYGSRYISVSLFGDVILRMVLIASCSNAL